MLGPQEQEAVARAIRDAEAKTDGEVAVVMAPESDSYADVVLHWAVLLALLPLALFATFPGLLEWGASLLHRGWGDEPPPLRLMLTIVLLKVAAAFLIGRFLFAIPAIKQALTPGATKARRVRRRAIMIFKASTERRTATRTGVLLYLSLAERRAEIVADQSIQSKISGEEWGDAMVALLDGVRAGRPGDGMAAAVGKIGDVLAVHFPYTGQDPNELPDRLIQL
jgi:putative membrane protein